MSENFDQIRILCVDDDRNVLRALERVFMDDDYEIVLAGSGDEGLNALEESGPFQVVISDYRMPVMNGVEFLKEVYKRWPETVRIVLSGYSDATAIVAAINEGHIYKFIPKPWNDNELRITIQNSLERYFLQKKNHDLLEQLAIVNQVLEEKAPQRTEQPELRNQELKFSRNRLANLPVGGVGIDNNGMIAYCNDLARGMSMRTVLFVDDEQSIRNAIERIYLERNDVRCLFAASGQEGLDILEREEVWVVVSDYQMPGICGVEFLSRVKRMRPDTLRIMMTAYADLSIAIDAINKSEAFRFITKPWNNQELLDTVDEALMRYQIIQSLRSEDETLYLTLAQTVELKDPYTKGHCDRVARYSVSLARAAGMNDVVINDIKHGSWLHDCGKIGVPERVLNYPGRLSEEDLETVMQHPRWGSEVARQARMSETVINIILYHHERFDGNGYPSRLKGDHIPFEARIVAIADVFDALYSDRPYRKAYDFNKAIRIMHEMTAAYFDPQLIDLFLPIAKEVHTNV